MKSNRLRFEYYYHVGSADQWKQKLNEIYL
jgi:hypothetical protein